MDQYQNGGHTYSFSYKDLKSQFEDYEKLSDSEFMADLPNITHFAVFVCWFKQLKTADVLSDTGLIHELVHLMTLEGYGQGVDWESGTPLQSIRKLFNDTCRLV